MTRAMCALAKGDFARAIHFHLLSPLAAALVLTLPWKFRWRPQLWTAGMVLIGVYGVWRAVGL